jgi:exonuclease VII small subunit
MKSKNIPADIKVKSIKEAQNEIQDIIAYLENGETNLKESIDKYNRMIHLNLHIQEEFKLKFNEIRSSKFEDQTHENYLEEK